ncbi:hypothetical protein, partial [Brucella intermedia]|uniref:hypothetical protein n=1 Tax=Brucella intermedia TaxID=94625 RepID=UPI001AECDE08
LISHVIVSDSAANGYELDVFTYLSALTGDYAPGGLGGALVAEARSVRTPHTLPHQKQRISHRIGRFYA